jgi:two-component system, cell cycle sensor histidine kinase and response regulator CckA
MVNFMTDKQNMHKPDLPQLTENMIALFQTTIEQSPQAVFWLNRKGQFEYVNKQACKSLGYTRDELLSLYLWDIDPDYSKERWGPHWEEMGKFTKRTFETKHMRKDGHIFPIEVTAYQINFEGKEFHAAFVNDITELVNERKGKKDLEEQLHQAQKLKAIGTLAGGIAHDFNNMLSVIIGYSELLKSTITEGNDLMKGLKEIEKAALRSRDITRQLLAFSRKQVITPIKLDINHQISDTLKMIGRLIGEQIVLEFNPQKEIWKTKLDPSQFDQILINLAVNARDAMPEGGELTISTFNRVLDSSYAQFDNHSSPGEYVLLSVSDNGIGMDHETVTHIFEPFFTTKELGKGTGLGLATIYGIIKQNHGIVDIQSRLGQGSTFNIYFPVFKDEGKNVDISDPVPISSGEGKILLVEDDDMVRKMTSRILESLGYTVLSVSNPFAAISFCSTNDTSLDLLFTDIVMPKMDGMMLSDKIKDLKPGIKVLLMSGYSQALSKRKGIIPKGMHFIEKPFSKNDLAVKIEEILNETKRGKRSF